MSTVPYNAHRFNCYGGTRKLATFAKAKAKASPERERLAALLAKQERSIQRAFALFVAASTDAQAMREAAKLLAANKINEALALVDRHIVNLANVLAESFVSVGTAETNQWADRLGVAVSFDQTAQRAVELMSAHRLNFIRGFSDQQRETTRAALLQGVRAGLGGPKIARVFRESIGLTTYQLGLVANYRRSLESLSAHALDYELRDTRFDRTVSNAIDRQTTLTSAQTEAMVSRYHANWLNERAETIARTASLQVMGQAQNEALDQTLAQAGIPRNLVVKKWNTTVDGRERDTHEQLDGQHQRLDDPFVSTSGGRMQFPGDTSLGAPPEERVNCRCVPSHIIAKDEDEVARLLEG